MVSINKSFSISVVLPTWNRVERLKKCLPTFLATKVQDVQFIIVDNNSDDGTWDYLQSVALIDKRVEIYKNSQNVGGPNSFFRAYCTVNSPYALFLGDDDLMVGDYIERCLEIFQKHHDVSMIHHLFDGWQRTQKMHKNPYTVYSKGSQAIDQIFMLSGSYSGLAIRMENFYLKNFPLGEEVIYPQVKIALEIARKHNIAIINHCGMITCDFGDTIINLKEVQNRPDSLGINERLSYLLTIKNPLLIQKQAMNLAAWCGSKFQMIEKIDSKETKKFVKSLVFTLNNVTPYFIITLFKIKRFKLAIFSLVCLMIKPSFFINYLWFLIFILRKVFSK